MIEITENTLHVDLSVTQQTENINLTIIEQSQSVDVVITEQIQMVNVEVQESTTPPVNVTISEGGGIGGTIDGGIIF